MFLFLSSPSYPPTPNGHDSRALRIAVAVHACRLAATVSRPPLARATRFSRATLFEAAKLAGAELGWDSARAALEVDEVLRQQAGLSQVEEPVG